MANFINTKPLSILFFLLIFLFPLPPLGAEEPEGFRGIKWGEHIKNIPGMGKIAPQDHIDIYKKEKDKLQIDETRVKTIEYYFFKDRFMGLYITFDGFYNFTAIKRFMFKAYGPGKKKNYYLDNFTWLTKSLLITLDYTASTNSGFILYCYLPLWNESVKNHN